MASRYSFLIIILLCVSDIAFYYTRRIGNLPDAALIFSPAVYFFGVSSQGFDKIWPVPQSAPAVLQAVRGRDVSELLPLDLKQKEKAFSHC